MCYFLYFKLNFYPTLILRVFVLRGLDVRSFRKTITTDIVDRINKVLQVFAPSAAVGRNGIIERVSNYRCIIGVGGNRTSMVEYDDGRLRIFVVKN